MLRVSFHGLRNEMYLPLGEICAPAISGLPKKSSRSIRAGCPAGVFVAAVAEAFDRAFAGAFVSCAPSTETAKTRHISAWISLFISHFLCPEFPSLNGKTAIMVRSLPGTEDWETILTLI